MNNRLRLVIALQLAFFAAWAGWLLTFSSRSVAEFCLDTLPVDPRDLLSGTYLELRYDISTPKGTGCDEAVAGGKTPVHVQLGPTGGTVSAAGRELQVYGAQACSAGKPADDGKIWVRGNRKGRWRGGQLDYGIEKFFISENDKRKSWTSGIYFARVQVDGLGNLRLLELIPKPPVGGTQVQVWPAQGGAFGPGGMPAQNPPPPLPPDAGAGN
ncbi:MAG: hypothetical protein A3J79_04945 [Elusimicrobia bacterium RIFOXYB2_FULL_62_6]|nr:MAG: hypothetical protein A3J79_04945 [Elusimicrobia bacterium RIFOXYB2_FULL_62_6]